MWLLDYLYFQSLRWMHRQGRHHRDAVDTAVLPLITALGVYMAGFYALVHHATGVNAILVVAKYWPEISEHGKYLKPIHGIGVLTGIAVIVFCYIRLERPAKREAIEARFFKTTDERELAIGHWLVLLFYLSAPVFAFASASKIFWLVGLIVAALVVGNVIVYRKHYKGRPDSA